MSVRWRELASTGGMLTWTLGPCSTLERGIELGPDWLRSQGFSGSPPQAEALANLRRLWARQTSCHSALTLARPLSRNWRKPMACLI